MVSGEKRQRAGAVQDAGANFCGFRGREASWSAAALRRFCIEQATRPAARGMSPAVVKSIYRFKMDRISAADEFEVSADW